MKNNNVYFRFFCCLTNVSANPADFTVTTNNLDTFCPRIVLVLSLLSLRDPLRIRVGITTQKLGLGSYTGIVYIL